MEKTMNLTALNIFFDRSFTEFLEIVGWKLRKILPDFIAKGKPWAS